MTTFRWTLAALAVGFSLLTGGSAQAQQSVRPCWYNAAGDCVFVSAANPFPISGSFSASGFPGTQTTGTPISVTTGGVTGTLPSGTVVVASNVGTTNAAYCKLGASATTSDQYIAPSGGWFAFTVGASTQLTCITSTSTTTVNMVGGSGLATGTGGGSGSGGSGLSVTDGATFTASSSSFTPSGGEYASSPTTCADGKQCTVAMTTQRAFTIDTPTTNNNLYAAIIAAVPALNATAFNTNSYSTGQTNPLNADLHGNLYVNVGTLPGQGPVTPGTAATNSILAGATYNSTAPTLTTGQQGPLQVSSRGGLLLGNGYPAGSTPITISGTGTTGATTATLATGASVTTYICGFSIRANATATATGNATVTGTITGTLNFTQWTAPTASGLGTTEMIFSPCVPASAVNTGIAVISAAPGTGGVVSVTAWGFTL